jgi:hypothetical protein
MDGVYEKSAGGGFSGGGLSFGASTSAFKGKVNQKAVSFRFGQDRQTGEVGLIKSSLDTSLVKEAIRGYLTQRGWKKAGIFG